MTITTEQATCMRAKLLHSCLTLRDVDSSQLGSACPWNSPGRNTGVGCQALLQGIFPTQGIESPSLTSPALAGGFFTTSTTGEVQNNQHTSKKQKQKNPNL